MIDLDAEVLHEHHREVITWVASLVPGRPLVIDLGAGTGVATMALARQLPDAEVIAVDIDEDMLGHIKRKAEAADAAGRVRTVQADLDQPWPALGPADLVWAANSLHHVSDPGHALAEAHAVLRPGGVLVINEMDSFPRFLPDEDGAALEDRAQAAMAEIRAEAGLHMDEDWGARLVQAGFTVEIRRTFDISLPPPLPAAAGRYAQVSLQRWRQGLQDRLGPADLAALEEAAASAPSRDDLVIRAVRTVWVGRR
jgi:SAM-dependent methyltransferase